MKKFKHTPGPWSFDSQGIFKEDMIIAPSLKAHSLHGGRISESDGRLIAAAPEMLETLIGWAIYKNEDTGGVPEYLADIIERATGLKIEEII